MTGADDLANWRRHVKDYLQTKYFNLLGLSERPNNANATQSRLWVKANIFAKGTSLFTLSNGSFAQVSTTVDDDD